LGEPPLLLSSSVNCATQAAIKEARKQLCFWKRVVNLVPWNPSSTLRVFSRGTDLDHGLLVVGYGLTGEKMVKINE
nr:abscisic aldehyde oxidase 3 [Tanacetum cinerariifolium]